MRSLSYLIALICIFSTELSYASEDFSERIDSRIQFLSDPVMSAHLYLVSVAIKAKKPPELADAKQMSILEHGIQVYKKSTSEPRFHVIFSQNEVTEITAQVFKGHFKKNNENCGETCQALRDFLPIYKQHLWQQQRRIDLAWSLDLKVKLAQVGRQVDTQLNDFFQTPVLPSVHRMYLVEHLSFGASTSGRTPDTIISSASAELQGWNGLEVVFHEIAHTYATSIESPLRETISQHFSDASLKEHQRIWHAIHFYTVGFAVTEAIKTRHANYQTYARKNGIYNRGWSTYYALIDEHWKLYLLKQISMDEAIQRIANSLLEADI